ncbi:MAG: TIGR02147 family protein [Fibrobacterales bacterium]
MTQLNIYSFYDYREFLKTYLHWQNENNPLFSHRWFTQKAGYRSTGLYLDIVQSKSNLTVNMASKFAKAMKLSEREHEYLVLLILYDTCKNDAAKEQYLEEIKRFVPTKYTQLKDHHRRYYENWYYSAIREALCILDIGDNSADLARYLKPNITGAQVDEALETLKELDLIEQDDDGFWKARNNCLSAGAEIGTESIRTYHHNMITLARESITRFTPDKRYVTSQSLAISQNKYTELLTKIKAIYMELFDSVGEDTDEQFVYQFNIQFFPLTESVIRSDG